MGFSASSVKRDEIMNFHNRSEGQNVIREEIDCSKNKKAITFILILKETKQWLRMENETKGKCH